MENKDVNADSPISSPKIKLNKIQPAAAEDEKKHYCKECDKGFTSGKALGGHVSSFHVQANKDYSHKRLASKINNFSGTTAAEISCNICSKGFRSEKSLYGHMRCHPERCYRGMEPPCFDLKNWPKEVMRGRGSLVREDPVKKSRRLVVVDGNNYKKKELDEDEEELVKTAVEVLMMGRLEKKHVCVLCDKAFDTHQALGGHRSSHNKLKLVIENEDKDVGKAKKIPRVINGEFRSKEPVGGHRSSQSKLKLSIVDEDKAKKCRVNGNVRSEKPVIGFDLNLMPEEDEDEDEKVK